MDGFKVIDGGKNPKHNQDNNPGRSDNPTLFDALDGEKPVDELDADTIPSWLSATPTPAAPSQEPQLSAQERRWAWAEIDLEAIKHNLKAIRKRIGPGIKIMAVVKDEGYGHGAVPVAKAALNNGASFLGVSTVDEGIALRRAGITAPVIILAEPPIASIPAILHYQLIPAIDTMEFALALGEESSAQNKVTPFHLKVDTGMNRLGVHHSDAGDFLRTISFHSGLELQGVFTHFATADEQDTYEFKLQLDRFNSALETIRYMGINPGIVHAANSAAAIRYKVASFNMVRIGIALYGLHPCELTRGVIDLHPAMSVHARVSYVKPVSVGEGVSYNLTYRSPGSVRIATVPIGYGDGLSRVLSNRMDVLVKGRLCPQVGNICMDMCMFEINMRSSGRVPRIDVEIGDEVLIIGRDGDTELTIDNMARTLGTNTYDICCRFGLRLEKVYSE
ncbi:MAG: alanine racemase [Coriobacteriales bacterium]|jgi:alanine racemase|nr:alanine racemase [Coriobacteriales bacterium]